MLNVEFSRPVVKDLVKISMETICIHRLRRLRRYEVFNLRNLRNLRIKIWNFALLATCNLQPNLSALSASVVKTLSTVIVCARNHQEEIFQCARDWAQFGHGDALRGQRSA